METEIENRDRQMPLKRQSIELDTVQDILTESFDPIVELTTGADLMMAMVYAQELGDWDYSGMYTAVLKFKVPTMLDSFLIASDIHSA